MAFDENGSGGQQPLLGSADLIDERQIHMRHLMASDAMTASVGLCSDENFPSPISPKPNFSNSVKIPAVPAHIENKIKYPILNEKSVILPEIVPIPKLTTISDNHVLPKIKKSFDSDISKIKVKTKCRSRSNSLNPKCNKTSDFLSKFKLRHFCPKYFMISFILICLSFLTNFDLRANKSRKYSFFMSSLITLYDRFALGLPNISVFERFRNTTFAHFCMHKLCTRAQISSSHSMRSCASYTHTQSNCGINALLHPRVLSMFTNNFPARFCFKQYALSLTTFIFLTLFVLGIHFFYLFSHIFLTFTNFQSSLLIFILSLQTYPCYRFIIDSST